MSLLDQHLENLKSKPDHIKKRIAFLTSLGITAVIFAFWVTSFGIQASSPQAHVENPGSALLASAGDAWNYIKNTFTTGNKSSYQAPSVQILPGNR